MNRLMKTLISSLFATMMFSFYTGSQAQIINDATATAHVADYDPISATLDSLVNLNYIQRLNLNSSNGTVNNFQPFEVPSYSADVYRKRIEKIQTPIPLCYNSQVQEYINLYAVKKRQLTERVMGLSGLYFPMYEEILDQQGLPLEFKYLSIVESALNPMAVSRVGATGLWQFMLGTGKLYNLKVNSFIDERRDPTKATLAACQYFKDMYAIYDDWLLVIAAYNCGAGNVNRAIARSGGKKTFWEIEAYLPKETRGYVPAFIAVTYLMSYPSEHNLIPVSPIMTYFEADTVMTDQKVSLKTVADAINVPVDLLSYLNPIYKRGIIPESDEPQALRLPSNKINSYLANIANIYKPENNNLNNAFASNEISIESQSDQLVKKYHKVKSGEHLQSIANRYNCTVNDIKSWNRLKGSKISAGQKLTVYVLSKKKTDKVAVKNSDVKTPVVSTSKTNDSKNIVKGDTKLVWHTVQPGDSLWSIAKSYEGVTVEQIKSLNNLQSNDLKVGTKLKVVVNG
jgi:membrane-bound lytic murein transglycosylase D